MKGDSLMTETMLTTIDNPFNPFEQFVDWYMYDCQMGYNTYSRIARLMPADDESLSSIEKDRIEDNIIDRLIRHDPLGIYTRVDEESAKIVAENASKVINLMQNAKESS